MTNRRQSFDTFAKMAEEAKEAADDRVYGSMKLDALLRLKALLDDPAALELHDEIFKNRDPEFVERYRKKIDRFIAAAMEEE